MKVGHILYKVSNLKEGVEHFRQQGFTVEYGRAKNPYNALIYFSEGPYLELLCDVKLPAPISFLLKLFGKAKVTERINAWHNAQEGLVGLCLENYNTNLEAEKRILEQHHQKYFERNTKRLDTQNRLLKFKVLFPYHLQLPFLMTYFNIDPKPKNYIHPNGVKKIKHISFGTDQALVPLIEALCDDPTLKLFVGAGVKDLEYEKA